MEHSDQVTAATHAPPSPAFAPRRKYWQVEDGIWFEAVMNNHNVRCCDCALVHTTNYKIKNGKLWIQVFRNNRSTAAARRKRPSRLTTSIT